MIDPQLAQQYLLAQQRRFEAQRAWLASTRGVGTLLGIGLFVLAAMRLVMLPLNFGFGMRVLSVLIRAPFVGELLGGGLIAVGWLAILGKEPRRDQRVLAIIGMLTGVALALAGISALAAADVFAAFGEQTTVWLEVAVTATALVGSSMWRSGPMPATAITAWCGFAVMLFTAALGGGHIGGVLWYAVFPVATWTLAGVSALGMRALRPDLPPGVPSAVVVKG